MAMAQGSRREADAMSLLAAESRHARVAIRHAAGEVIDDARDIADAAAWTRREPWARVALAGSLAWFLTMLVGQRCRSSRHGRGGERVVGPTRTGSSGRRKRLTPLRYLGRAMSGTFSTLLQTAFAGGAAAAG